MIIHEARRESKMEREAGWEVDWDSEERESLLKAKKQMQT